MKIAHRLLALGLCVAAIAGAKANILDWQLNGRGGQVVSGLRLTLANVTNGSNLKYGKRTWGINLTWDKTPDLHNIQIVSRGSAGRPILLTQRVAIYVKDGGYLKYEKRTFGINLGWSSTPVFEWLIGGSGGDPGQPVQQNQQLCLYNTVARDFVIYDNRAVGINMVWSKDKGTKTWTSMFKAALVKVGNVSKKMSDWMMSLFPEDQ